MQQFKSTFGITTFVLAIVFLFNSFLAFLLMALVGVLIYPKTSQYIRQKYKLNQTLKNIIIVFLFPVGFILGMYHSTVSFDKIIPQQKDSQLKIIQLIKSNPLKNIKKTDPNFIFNDYSTFGKEKVRMQEIMDSINVILKSKNLTICRVINDIEQIENSCQKEADLAYPNFDYPEHVNYLEDCEKKKVKAYKKRKNINESIYDNIMHFIGNCTELERFDRISKLREKARLRGVKDILNGENCITKGLDTRHLALANLVKSNLSNPSSFEHIETNYKKEKDYMIVKMVYRGENGNGDIVTHYIVAKVDLKDCNKILEIVEQ